MEFINGVSKAIEYIYNDIRRLSKIDEYSIECEKLKEITDMARNKVYPSIIKDLNIYKNEIVPVLTLSKWKDIEAKYNKLQADFDKYNNIRYMYNRWLHMIFNEYAKSIVRYYDKFYILESVYDCIHFAEYLNLTMPDVCYVNSDISSQFKISPIYKTLKIEPRSIYQYDPNYKYENEHSHDTVFALLNKRR